jgi:hypothetical protein
MLEQHLRQLIEHWRALAAEAKQQGQDSQQSPLLRGHAFGVSDGLEIAAHDLDKVIEKGSGTGEAR